MNGIDSVTHNTMTEQVSLYNVMQGACVNLVEGLGWHAGGNDISVDAAHACAMFLSPMPWRDYDNSSNSIRHAYMIPLTHVEQPIVTKKRTRPIIADDDPLQMLADTKQKVRLLETSEMPEKQVTVEQTQAIDANKSSTTISDVNTADVRDRMDRGIGEATQSYRSRLAENFAANRRTMQNDVLKMTRTLMIMLLEPVALTITSIIQRPDADLEAREQQRLVTRAPPTIDDVRAMNKYLVSLTLNLFGGCPEFAFDVTTLSQRRIVEALYSLVRHGDVFFAEHRHTSTHQTLCAFRYNSHIERRVDRGALLGRTCRALVQTVDACYAATLRQRLMLALDAAMTELVGMKSGAVRNAKNLEHLQRAKRMLSDLTID